MNGAWLLPYTRPKNFKAGSILMERGEYATAAYYLVAGEVEVVEIHQTFGKGTLLGEIGLFTPGRPAHQDGALQDRRPDGSDRL
jgi:CRP-like cAMP-binding protein